MGETHKGNSDYFPHHKLNRLNRRDYHLYHPAGFLFNHTSHNLGAKDENKHIHKKAADIGQNHGNARAGLLYNTGGIDLHCLYRDICLDAFHYLIKILDVVSQKLLLLDLFLERVLDMIEQPDRRLAF